MTAYTLTAPPAAVLGPPTRQRCRSPRGLGLRAVPIRLAFYPTDDVYAVRALRDRLREAYADGGRADLAWELREAIREAASGRAVTVDEHAAVLAWARYTNADALPAWLAAAAVEGWPRPGQ